MKSIRIDGENMGGANDPDLYDSGADATKADYKNICTTDEAGTCTGTVSAAAGQLGSATLCFWIDNDTSGVPAGPNDTYDPGGAAANGGGCDGEVVGDPENDDSTDSVSIKWDSAASTVQGVDLTPELLVAPAGSSPNVVASIYDQYGDPFVSPNTPVRAEYFSGSAGDTDGNVTNPPDVLCNTANTSSCSLPVRSNVAGAARLCGWIGADPTMAGTEANGTCKGDGMSADEGTDDGNVINSVDVTRITWTAAQPTTTTTAGNATTTTTTKPAEEVASDQGYTLVGSDGGIFNYGTSKFHGSTGDKKLNKPIIGMANKKGGTGYWLVASDGGIFTFGDAGFFGSLGDKKLNAPILGMEATPTGNGYWLFASDGGIFTFGDAAFKGSTGDKKLNAPVVGMAITEKGDGYWLVAKDGGIFTFNAPFHGSTGDKVLNEPVFDMGSRPGDKGYWLVARDGGIFTFGDASFYGSAVGSTSAQVIGIGVSPTGTGYWIADAKGSVFPFGDARFLGDRRTSTNNATTVGFATVPKK